MWLIEYQFISFHISSCHFMPFHIVISYRFISYTISFPYKYIIRNKKTCKGWKRKQTPRWMNSAFIFARKQETWPLGLLGLQKWNSTEGSWTMDFQYALDLNKSYILKIDTPPCHHVIIVHVRLLATNPPLFNHANVTYIITYMPFGQRRGFHPHMPYK